jgi:GH25 family lysozyme M1 (1,4-beta-N-acetylmuramidase)
VSTVAELHLPDVSEFQPDVDWAKVVAKNGGAAIIRALYGTSHVDNLWIKGRRDAAHNAGVKVLGIYHYLTKDQDPVAQAEVFVRTVGTLRRGEFAVLDLEEGSGDQSGRAKQWFKYVDARLTYPGYRGAWLYSGDSFLASELNEFLTSSHRNIWVADYGAKPGVRHVLWQHTDGTHAVPPDWHQQGWPGIGRCDCSVFEGTLPQLAAVVHG